MRNKIAHGFTLVELIIYIGIFSLIVVGLMSFALSMTIARTKTYVGQEVTANARVALDIITQKIHAAQGVNVVGSTFKTDPGVLSLEMADVSKNPTIINLNANDGRLQIKEGAASEVFLTSREVQVKNLIFRNLTQNGERENIWITLTVQYGDSNTGDYSYSWTGSTTVSVRQ
ncbi:MAG: prepilin-type N-terminal cleavage/methylation domain-containing protein [Patescibacteria group bacterium]